MAVINYLRHKSFYKGLLLFVICFFVLFALPKKVFAEVCEPNSGEPTGIPFAFSYRVENLGDNSAGKQVDDVFHWNLSRGQGVRCKCPVGETYNTVYYTTRTSLPFGHVSGGKTFYTVGDYFEVSTRVFLGGKVNNYIETPLSSFPTPVNTPTGDPCSPTSSWVWRDGSDGYLSMYIKKSFIGTVTVPSTVVFDLYANTTPNAGPVGVALSRVSMSGSVSAPQSCTVNAGQIITVDFGDIWSGKFKEKGQKPGGVDTKTITFPVSCAGGVESSANLTVSFQSTPDANYPDAISSDNPDVGVTITDMANRVIPPNTGLIPFTLENNQAQVSFKAYPVSTTGKAPAEGKFTALAYLRIDFA